MKYLVLIALATTGAWQNADACSGVYNFTCNNQPSTLIINADQNGNFTGQVYGNSIHGYCRNGVIDFIREIPDGHKILTQHYAGALNTQTSIQGNMDGHVYAGPNGPWFSSPYAPMRQDCMGQYSIQVNGQPGLIDVQQSIYDWHSQSYSIYGTVFGNQLRGTCNPQNYVMTFDRLMGPNVWQTYTGRINTYTQMRGNMDSIKAGPGGPWSAQNSF